MPAPASPTPDFNDADARRAEKTLLERVAQARAEARRVDLTTAFCAFATLALGVLFLGVLLDHWVLTNGLSPRGRLLFAVCWVASTTLYFVVRLVPILRRQIAPLYAAKILEESWNDPHNSAISWLQLRREAADARKRSQKAQKTHNGEAGQGGKNAQNSADSTDSADFNAVDPSILRGVALQAANRAASAPSETLVDCSGLIRWGVAFAVVVAVCALYSVFSPKSPFASVGRIVAPTAAIERPQAVALEEVSPGDATVYQGDFLDVAAKIDGADSLPVEIFYSTEDGRLVDLRVPMKAVGASRFEARFPDGDDGFSEPLTYRVVVGKGGRFESVSPTYRVDVKPRPTFQVEKTTLKFPDYTGLTPQTFANQGDVRAVEGTTVEIVARSNSPLESALFLPNGDESKGAKMQISPDNPRLATFEFRLDWKRTSSVLRTADAEEKVPTLTSYRLLSVDVDGQRNRDARDYSVETLVDVPPTIRWESAPESGSTAALNDALRFQVWAEDPDFGLRSVRVRTAIRDLDEGASAARATPAPIETPLRSRSAKPGVGPSVLSGAFVPAELGFQIGDEIEYWVEAVDSKEPEPNVAATEKLLIVVGEPVANPSSPDAEAEDGENSENGEENGGESGQNSESGQTGEEGGESETGENKQDSQNQQGSQNGESGEAGQNAQNQQGGESEEAGQNAQNQQGGESEEAGQNAQDQQGGESEEAGQNAQGGADSNASEQTGQTEQTGPNPSNGQNEQNRETGQNGENAPNGEANSPAPGAPESVDPEANPGDAFEKALDFLRSERENAESGAQGTESNAEPPENGRSGQNKESGENAQNRESANNAQAGENGEDGENPQNGETSSTGENNAGGEKSNERRSLPNPTSAERPSDDAERFDAENPEKIDPNARRENGEVDPNTNDYLAQTAPADAPENPNGAPQDANVLADPLENFAGSGADVAPNAQELKGANNAETDPNGASEPDRDPAASENSENTQNDEPAESGQGGENAPLDPLDGGGNGSDSASDATGSNEKNENADKNGGGSASDRPQTSTGPKSEDQDGTIGAGGDSQSGKRGGGGGSGLGELGPDEASLTGADAPSLQYAEAATNLVLDYLDDVLKEKADRRILDELGWTEEQLRAFLERWKAMKAAAESGDENAKVEYLQALENLGLDAPDASEPLDATRGRAS
ncbi:MAG: hypothetical protein IKK39_00805, partial [Thermoguttaceae bacterium]|nr:hypothetical protein [Thermoguttaceae bacterium]